MYERLLTEAERFLEEQKPKEVPILEMWDAMLERSEEGAFDMPENIGDFECLLEADKRFVFVNTKAPQEMADIDIGEEEGEYEVGEDFFAVEEIEKLGFNEHQSIGLKKYAKTRSDDDDDDGPGAFLWFGSGQSAFLLPRRRGSAAHGALLLEGGRGGLLRF